VVSARVVLFGAFDRHNLGDLLMPHVAAALLPGREPVFAGLVERDLSGAGGHWPVPLARIEAHLEGGPGLLVHVGGEILTCDAWRAAVMLLPPAWVRGTVGYLEARSAEREAWVRHYIGCGDRAPYVASRPAHPALARVIVLAAGGVELDTADAALREEVLAKLRAADALSVRDWMTQQALARHGIAAPLLPDLVVLVEELFGDRIRARADDPEGEVAAVRRAFPGGYLAVQLGAEFADDVTLACIASQLDRAAAAAGCGIALFRAGAAPWHDDEEVLERLAARLRPGSVHVFRSVVAWDLCALIAAARAYAGCSLHGRIVALAFARPRVNVECRAQAPRGLTPRHGKQGAFAATWDDPGMPGVVAPKDLGEALAAALRAGDERLRATARRVARACRDGLAPVLDDVQRFVTFPR
jgi:hypothetical protein